MTEFLELENVLLKYIEKYGLTDAARAYFQKAEYTFFTYHICHTRGITGKDQGDDITPPNR
ncbi:MAG: hypothetical protein ACRBBO_01970 [Cognatishimia sp.]